MEHMKRNKMLDGNGDIIEDNKASENVALSVQTSSQNAPPTNQEGTSITASATNEVIETDPMAKFKEWIGESTDLHANQAQTSVLDKGEEAAPEADGLSAEAERVEVLFIRRMRMGGLKANINTMGFSMGLNFKNLLAEVDSYTIHGEALDWRDLAYRLISHMGWSVARHATTSRISKLFGNWGSSSTTTTTGNNMVLTNSTQPSGAGPPESANTQDTNISPSQQSHDSHLLKIPFAMNSRRPDTVGENMGALNQPSSSRHGSEMRHSTNVEKLLGRRPVN